jgi:hypothetical protein
MISKILRSITSVELTSSVPPKLVLNLNGTQHEFKLQGEKMVSNLFDEIKSADRSIKSLSITAENEQVDISTQLSSITKKEFTLSLNKTKINVLPGLAMFIRGNESYYSKCHDLGVPFNEARSIARFLDTLETNLPETFNQSDLQEALKVAKTSFSSFHEEEVEILKRQLSKFESDLKPLTEEMESIKKRAENYADRMLKVGLGVLCSQWLGICYGTFVVYGWDVMEPFSYMVGSTWALLGFGWFLRQRQEFYPASFREMIYTGRLVKLMRKEKFPNERIDLLKKNIEMIRKVINEIE